MMWIGKNSAPLATKCLMTIIGKSEILVYRKIICLHCRGKDLHIVWVDVAQLVDIEEHI